MGMQKYIFIAVAVILGAGIIFTQVSHDEVKVVNVSEIGNNPAAFTGTITLAGIMAVASQNDRSVFGIMDTKELQCKTGNCNKIYIPVKYMGKQPIVGDEVRATGKFIKLENGYTFAAEKVKVVGNRKI
jgi:hypothetical protein